MQLDRTRITLTLAVVLVAALAGTVIGYGLGRVVALRLAYGWLDQYSMRVILLTDDGMREAHALLDNIHGLGGVPCSDADLVNLRHMLYRADTIRDIGRIRNNKLLCTAEAGKLPATVSAVEPDFMESNGIAVFTQLNSLFDPSMRRIGLTDQGAYVSYVPRLPTILGPVPLRVRVTLVDRATGRARQVARNPLPSGNDTMTHPGRSRQGQTIFSTSCSIHYGVCATAFAPLNLALHSEDDKIEGGALTGMLIGAGMGLLFSLLYRDSRSMVQQLRRALRNNGLRMVYQPIVRLGDRRIVGVEALVRWTDEDGMEISPEIFVRLAEERGMIGDLTRFVVTRALSEWSSLLRQHPDFTLSLNITASDLSDPSFLPMLEAQMSASGVPTENVILELTESGTAHTETAVQAIAELRRRGHRMYIDDFGTGYSSLSYLHRLDVDALKIDRAFTQAIGTESITVSLLPQIMAMGRTLNLSIVVEGVETEEQAGYFSLYGENTLAQGWLFGRPLPAVELRGKVEALSHPGTALPAA